MITNNLFSRPRMLHVIELEYYVDRILLSNNVLSHIEKLIHIRINETQPNNLKKYFIDKIYEMKFKISLVDNA